MICEQCKKHFKEEDLDLHNGKWLCHDCEESKMSSSDFIQKIKDSSLYGKRY